MKVINKKVIDKQNGIIEDVCKETMKEMKKANIKRKGTDFIIDNKYTPERFLVYKLNDKIRRTYLEDYTLKDLAKYILLLEAIQRNSFLEKNVGDGYDEEIGF